MSARVREKKHDDDDESADPACCLAYTSLPQRAILLDGESRAGDEASKRAVADLTLPLLRQTIDEMPVNLSDMM